MLKKDHRENIYDFDIPLFCNSDKKQINNKSIPVTYYDHVWCHDSVPILHFDTP